MNDLQVIQSAVAGVAGRRRLERGWRGAWRGLLVTSFLWLIALGMFKFYPIPWGWLAAAGLAGLLAPLVGFTLGGWRQSTLDETARWLDARQQLKERLGTAWEVSARETEWTQLLLHDAARHVEGIEPRQLVPLRLPRTARWAALVLAVVAGLGWAPEYRGHRYLQQQAEAANIRETGRQLAELTRRSLAQRPPALEPTQKAMVSMAELGQMLDRVPLTRSEALRELANVAEKLNKGAEELSKSPALQPLERAAREPGGSPGQTPEALQRQIDSLRKSLGNDKATPEALDKLKAALEQAQKSGASLPDRNSPAGQAAREQLAQSLASMAQAAREMGQPLASLEAAMAALEKNQVSQFLKDLDQAALDLEKLRETAKALAQLQQQAAQLGKDLAEQLQNGQADAARRTLEKMAGEMGSASLTSEQLGRTLEEVSKAIDPAGEYGKVADLLKAAVKQMQQARQTGSPTAKSQAGQSLAQAAKELEKLGQEMGDMQSLADALEALSRAEQAIASGQSWGQCNRPGGLCANCKGKGCALCRNKGWGHGRSLSASGVGTWADEKEGWSYYPDQVPQAPVDNSGVKRPDLDPRGLSDRGPGELSEALKPTKVKGKMAPGGPMPSITLKGVSIKGQSNVKFEEAAATAQSEAQNALNQDQVPRVYQNVVKDYFDDLKK
jgi:tetratricopeptide (TPR) repeat protein